MIFKKWYLKNESGEIVKPLLSLEMNHSEGLPATLEWESPQNMKEGEYTLWCEDVLVFRGWLWKTPLKKTAEATTWYAIAMDEKTYGKQWRELQETLGQGIKLKGPKEIVGPYVGTTYIHPVTHTVSWVSYEKPRGVLSIKESATMTPTARPLRGIRAEVLRASDHVVSGVMDTSQHLEGLLGGPLETKAPKELKKKWNRLGLRLTQAGYDPQKKELVSDSKEKLHPKMVFGWNQRIYRKTLLSLEAGEEEFEVLPLTLLDKNASEQDFLEEMKVWMKSYSISRSFSASGAVEFWAGKNIEDISLTKWLSIAHPAHPQGKISGPITKIQLVIKYGFAIATVHFKWAPEESFFYDGPISRLETRGEKWSPPQSPTDIIAWATCKKESEEIDFGVRTLPVMAVEELEEVWRLGNRKNKD